MSSEGKPLPWCRTGVVPALGIHTIHTNNGGSTRHNRRVNGVDHSSVFEIVETTFGGGEHQKRQAIMAEGQQLHLPTELRTPPSVVFTIHGALPRGYKNIGIW